jgi:signal transduction histidine kinase
MSPRPRSHAPATLFVWFALLAGVPLAALGWVGWRWLAQEQSLDRQREHERLETAAVLVAGDIDRSLAEWEQRLASIARGDASDLPSGAAAITISGGGVADRFGVALPYYPAVAPPREAGADRFAAGEALEFGHRDLAAAERIYRRHTADPDRPTRAAALMRLARTLRAQKRTREAAAVYADLAAIGSGVWVAGAPAELVARRERVALAHELGDEASARAESSQLADSLWSGRYAVDRATFEFYLGELAPDRTAADRLMFARAFDSIWPAIQQRPNGRLPVTVDDVPLIAVWRRTGPTSAVMLGRIDAAFMRGTFSRADVRVRIDDETGRRVWGDATGAPLLVTKSARETGLPLAVRVGAADAAAAGAASRSRRNLLVAGFVLMTIVVATAAFAVFRAVRHELDVARLQSDFVATVSHEFRSPLTAMRHLTEVLDAGEAEPDRVPRYYRALVKETRRLERLVEGLLDFGRMEAGRRTYRMEAASAAEIARHVLDEFADSPGAMRLEWDGPSDGERAATIRADRQAIGLALRNLVDNALKYSPDSAPVRVSVRLNDAEANISVADRGPGIPPSEQREIFRKFVRGSAAASLHVKGTGIGLAIADHIVSAHGGRLRVESEPGRGSCFTIVLPTTALMVRQAHHER